MYSTMVFKGVSKEQDLILGQVHLYLGWENSQVLWQDVLYCLNIAKIAPYQNRRTVLIVGSLITAIIGITFIT